ncbi:MAG: AMP-binding protein [Planctomycetaceae bacterium]|nr:AMP-binding protein [Planctomycetaceae bacterium]
MIEQASDSAAATLKYTSLVDVLRRRFEDSGDKLAYQFLADGSKQDARLTYSELADRSHAVAMRLQAIADRGDRALLLYPPGPEFLLALFGCLQAGIIAIPLSPPDSSRIKRALPRLTSVAGDADASLVLTTAGIHDLLKVYLDDIQEMRELKWHNTDNVEGSGSYGARDAAWEPSPSDLAFLQYTSGSTSSPKGVMVSHGNVLAQCGALKLASGYTSTSVTATWMPYFHDYGLIEGLLMPFYVGVPCYFMSPLAFIKRPLRWLELISRYRVTHSQGPNFAYDLCIRKANIEQLANIDLHCWVSAANGAESVRPSTVQAFYEMFKGCGLRKQCLSPAYGLAESTLVVSVTSPDEEPALVKVETQAYERGRIETATAESDFRTLASSGRPIPGTQVEIVDPATCRRCSSDEVGEIWVAGPSVAQGYWKQQEATACTFHARIADSGEGPFLRTGDLGFLQDGRLFITGRLKDLIIIRGLNHYPQDIELTVERSHPAMRPGCGAAFSVEVAGEEELVVVHDIVGKHQRNLDEDDLFSAIRAAVFDNHDLRLHAVVLLKPGGVLKTTSGKIQRAAMKAAFLAGTLDSVAKWELSQTAKDVEEPAFTVSTDSIRDWLVNWLAARTGVNAKTINTSSKFSDCGLDSMRAADLAVDLEKLLHQRIDPIVFWNFPTIDAIAESLSPQRITRTETSQRNGGALPIEGSPRIGTAPVSRAIVEDTIAIIGMGCRFPGGVDSPERYWRLLREGGNAITEIPATRWDVEEYYDPNPAAPGKMYTRRGGFINEVDAFDPAFFGITPREAIDIDPQQRLLLEVVWESLEHAGIPPSSLNGSETGVFLGLSSDDYATAQHFEPGDSEIDAYKILGTARSIASGRVGYLLGVHGPVVQLDTACSSSLVSVYQACQSLHAGECDMAIAGGVNLILSPETMVALCKLTALAPDGRCKTFAAAADGYVRGEGCGIVVLKRLKYAVRDGDMVYAKIRSAVVNHDGASNGLTAPNGQAQKRLIEKALKKANLSGCEVAYVEAHGTGTELGDPIELDALNSVYCQNRPRSSPLFVGSTKTNIGHLEAAAGIAGLLKVVLMLQHRQIPPHLNFEAPNPHFPWDDTPVNVPTEIQDWPVSDRPGLAAISSFGFSGTNAHVIVEGVDARDQRRDRHAASARPSAQLHLLPLSAKSDDSLVATAQRYLEHLIAHPDQAIEDICFTAATARDHFAHRLAVIANTREECIDKLRAFASGEDRSAVILGTGRSHASEATNKIAYLFTGQGTQYVGMGSGLYESQPVFRAAIDRCRNLVEKHSDNSQAEFFSVQYALAELWRSWGITPAAVLGHSLGEYAAACVAGVFDLETAIELVATRSRLMDSLPERGAMAVVMADESRVAVALRPFGDKLSIASINGPETIVISGSTEAVHQIVTEFASEGVDTELLDTSQAGHSKLIDPMLEPFAAAALRFKYSSPRLDLISNVSGTLAGEEVATPQYWIQHLRATVRFADGMKALAETGCRTFIELGPNPNLLAMGMGCVPRLRPRPQWLPSLTRGSSDCETMLYSLGKLYAAGAKVDWQSFYRPFAGSRVSLPTYAFHRQSYAATHPERPSRRNCDREKSYLVSPTVVASKMKHLCFGLEAEARSLTPRLDEIAVHFIIDALKQMGCEWRIGAQILASELEARIPDHNRCKVTRVLSRFVEQGWLQHVEGGHLVVRSAPNGNANDLLDALQKEATYPECHVLHRAGTALARIWQGDVDPLSVLFPDGTMDQAVSFYSQAKLLAGYNALAGEALQQALSTMPKGESLRLLEVGAGTGGLTTHLLPRLPKDGCEYVFTDISPSFLHAASDRFGEYASFRTQLLDISQSLPDQNVEPNSFDLVIAANVLHATPLLHETLANVRRLLKPDGWLVLLEAANPPLWGDMVFTLIDGWWNFADKDVRPDYPLMRRDRWCHVLRESGFDDIACLNDEALQDDSSNTLYLAQSRTLLPRERALHSAARTSPWGNEKKPAITEPTSIEQNRADRPTLREMLVDVADEGELSTLVREHAAQVMRLKPEQIDPTQPLAELGLDSLMATELRGRLGNTLGHELTLNALQMRRSIEEIVSYVLRGYVIGDAPSRGSMTATPFDVNTPRVHIVPLQPNGNESPLFFVPAGHGDLVAFEDIAHAIGRKQPVYALQPASAKQLKTFRQMSIYRLVSAYIAEIKKVQPHGPYLLSGYSAGGIIVVEIARELLRQGDEVGLLVIFDPPSHVPFWLDWFYSATYRACQFTGMLSLVNSMRFRFVRRLFHAFLDEGLRTHTTVTREHRVVSYPGRITHFRARLSQSGLVSMRPVGRFWRNIAQGGIEVHWIPGTHYGMLRGSGAVVVVDELHDCIQRARRCNHTTSILRENEAT